MNTASPPPAPRAPLKPLDEAQSELLAFATPLARVETVSTFDADGRVLAQEVVSALQVPPQDNSSMDGYRAALRRCGRRHGRRPGGVAAHPGGQPRQPAAAGHRRPHLHRCARTRRRRCHRDAITDCP